MSSIMSILVLALNLRLSADEKVDFAPSSKCRLSETAWRRWLECNLTRHHFRTPWCSLMVVLLWTFGRHQLRLCMCYVNLSAVFTPMFNFVNLRQKRNMRIIHRIMHCSVFRCFYPRFLGSVGISSTVGGNYAPIYMKTRGLRASECYLQFSMPFAVFGWRCRSVVRQRDVNFETRHGR
jgi:hypothetical protein